MTQVPSSQGGPVITVKPQPDVYTLLLAVGIIALSVTIGFVLYNLLADLPNGYGLTFTDLFKPFKSPVVP